MISVFLIFLLQTTPIPPTETPKPIFFFDEPVFPTIEPPTVIPTRTIMPTSTAFSRSIPESELYVYISTLNAESAMLPDDLSNPGVPLLPSINPASLWGYAKWLISPSTADELFGPLAMPITHSTALLLIVLTLGLIYALIVAVRFVVKFVVWIVQRILDFIPFFG
jgi:hypothetical protein